MSILNKLESKINDVVDDLDYKKVVEDSENGLGNDSYVYCLNIPIIGGLMYVYKSYRQSEKFMREYRRKSNMRKQVINIIKDEEMVSRSLRKQLNNFLDTKEVSVIEVPDRHLTIFKIVIAEYSDVITWSARPDGKIVLVRQNAI